MSVVVVGVGTNLGAREAAIAGARCLLDARPGIRVTRSSTVYETEPLGPPQDRYLNAALRLETVLAPPSLLDTLLRIERRLGRIRDPEDRWGPRSVDLDLLWDERGVYESPGLRVPHAELSRRSFALAPLIDVAPELGERFESALTELGGAPATLERPALTERSTTDGRIEVVVEANTLADACALSATFDNRAVRPWATRHAVIDPSPERFIDVLRDLLRTGFLVRCTTVSHCSETQWIAQFHGVNVGIPLGTDVRLQTTSGDRRAVRATLTVDPG